MAAATSNVLWRLRHNTGKMRYLHTMLLVGEAEQIFVAVAIRWRLQSDLGEWASKALN
jgi:hypothetical protein